MQLGFATRTNLCFPVRKGKHSTYTAGWRVLLGISFKKEHLQYKNHCQRINQSLLNFWFSLETQAAVSKLFCLKLKWHLKIGDWMRLEDWHRLGWLPGRCYVSFRECRNCCCDTHFSFGLGLGCWQPQVRSSFAKSWNTGRCTQSTYSLLRLIHFVKYSWTVIRSHISFEAMHRWSILVSINIHRHLK